MISPSSIAYFGDFFDFLERVCVGVGVVPGCATPRFWLFLGPFFYFMHLSEFPFGRKKTSEVKYFSLFFSKCSKIFGEIFEKFIFVFCTDSTCQHIWTFFVNIS